jgi:DNA-binding response OmpR family regulator
MTKPTFNTVHFPAKAHLFKEGEKADCAYIIQTGSVKISKRGPSGRGIAIATAGKGGIVGEMAIISDAPRSATVTAVEPVEAIAISKSSFDARLKDVDPFLYNLITTIIARLRKTSDHTVALYEKAKSAEKSDPMYPAADKKKTVSKNGLSSVNFMLADPNRQTRNSLRSGLFGHGFREIADISSHTLASEELLKKHYDLLILDSAFGLSILTKLIQDIRHGTSSQNPFLSIVVMTENEDKSVHKSLKNAGCDEILIKPLSLNDIMSKIQEMAIQDKRKFVVTRDYVGPDRPEFKNQNGQDAPSFSPPDSLAAKIITNVNEDRVERAINKGVMHFNELKMERQLVQTAWLLDQLNPKNGEPYDLRYLLERMDEVLEDLNTRIDNSRFASSTQTCAELRMLSNGIRESEEHTIEKWDQMNRFYHELLENIPLVENDALVLKLARA